MIQVAVGGRGRREAGSTTRHGDMKPENWSTCRDVRRVLVVPYWACAALLVEDPSKVEMPISPAAKRRPNPAESNSAGPLPQRGEKVQPVALSLLSEIVGTPGQEGYWAAWTIGLRLPVKPVDRPDAWQEPLSEVFGHGPDLVCLVHIPLNVVIVCQKCGSKYTRRANPMLSAFGRTICPRTLFTYVHESDNAV